jgi:hypothetical protein
MLALDSLTFGVLRPLGAQISASTWQLRYRNAVAVQSVDNYSRLAFVFCTFATFFHFIDGKIHVGISFSAK